MSELQEIPKKTKKIHAPSEYLLLNKFKHAAYHILLSDSAEQQMLFDEIPFADLSEASWPQNLKIERRSKKPGSIETYTQKTRSPIEKKLLLFHQLANHELAAIELMALTLIRAKDLTLAQARSIYATMLDEKRHFNSYLGYLGTHDCVFGSFERSPFFWNLLSEHIDRVGVHAVGVSLTLEQANLDFAKHYLGVFEGQGDLEAVKILAGVYEDEVRHVGLGVQILKKIQNELSPGKQKSLWDLYLELLPESLSPRRARGIGFDRSGRENAGLDKEFINKVEHFQESRGRPGSLYVFNPHEENIEGISSKKNINLRLLSEELALNFSSLLTEADYLFCQKRPSEHFLHNLKSFGIGPFSYLTPDDLPFLKKERLKTVKPWYGLPYSPENFDLAASPKIKQACPLQRKLNSKFYSAVLYNKLNENKFLENFPFTLTLAPQIVGDHSELKNWIKSLPDKVDRFILKEEFSLAGGGRRILSRELSEQDQGWLENVFKRKRQLRCEISYDRCIDFSLVFEVGPKAAPPTLLRQVCSPSGRYLGHQLGKLFWDLDPNLRSYLGSKSDDSHSLKYCLRKTALEVQKILGEQGYSGPAGIDSFVARDHLDRLVLNPFCEINARFTFGHLAKAWGNKVQLLGKKVLWRHYRLPELQQRGFPSIETFKKHLLARTAEGLGQHLFTNDPVAAVLNLSVIHIEDPDFVDPQKSWKKSK